MQNWNRDWRRLRAGITCVLLLIAFTERALAANPSRPFADFDPSHAPAPPQGATVVARVFDTYLTADSLAGPRDQRADALASLIWRHLAVRFMAEEGITTSEAELDALLQTMNEPGQQPRGPEQREFARTILLQWKLDRTLYARYGGGVVWQLTDPLTPVDAYRSFLTALEERKVFEIRDPGLREGFWNLYRYDPAYRIPPEKVSYQTPWWLWPTPPAPYDGTALLVRTPQGNDTEESTTPLCGYEVHGDQVRFIFNPAYHHAATNGKSGEWTQVHELKVRTVHLAGDFNHWSSRDWLMRPVGPTGSLFIIDRSISELGGQGDHEFKFVVNGEWWVEPAMNAPNQNPTGLENASTNYFVHLFPSH
jgi:hypothetical protein